MYRTKFGETSKPKVSSNSVPQHKDNIHTVVLAYGLCSILPYSSMAFKVSFHQVLET